MAVKTSIQWARVSRASDTTAKIIEVALGFMASKQLFVASEIGLFEHLEPGPSTLDELAERMAVPRRTLRIIADAMVALGLLDCDADRYENSAAAQAYLSGQTAEDLRPLLALWDRLSYPALRQLAASVRSGRAMRGGSPEEEQRIYSAGVEALIAGPARALARTYDFSPHRCLLGLGGGIGAFLVAIVDEWPELAATLLKLPAIVPLARRRVDGDSASTRIEVVSADFFTEPIPAGHDVVILANVVHVLSPQRNRALLRRMREGVVAGARLLLIDLFTDQTRTQPLAAALLAAEFLVLAGEGDVYTEREVRGWLYTCGWQPLQRWALESPWSVLVAQAA
jgi:O-methyltransferase/methyltransferase family protein